MNPSDLKICQDCNSAPAIYGDGATWSRCSACQLKSRQSEGEKEPKTPASVKEDGFPHQTKEGLVSIIMPVYIVNYTLFHYTGNAIGSIREHTKKPFELVVVDNGSPIKPPTKNSYYAEKVISNEENKGFTKAVNQGIRASFGEYVVLINNDVQVFDHWLDDMTEALNHVDLVMSYPMYSKTEPFARALESKRIRDQWMNKPIEESFSDFRDFSCVMFKKSLIDEIGLFDEDFVSYASDTYFLKKMDEAGKKYASCKRVAIHHVSDATGFSLEDTPAVMDADKATYARKVAEDAAGTINEEGLGKAGPTATEKQVNPQAETTPEPQKQAESKPAVPTPVQVDCLVRTKATGDRVFYLKDNTLHWVMNPETLKALGFVLGQEKIIEREEYAKYDKGEPISMANVENYKNAQS